MASQVLEEKLSSVPEKEQKDGTYQPPDEYMGCPKKTYAGQPKLEHEETMNVINEAMVNADTIELTPTRRLGLDACGCTGNGSCG